MEHCVEISSRKEKLVPRNVQVLVCGLLCEMAEKQKDREYAACVSHLSQIAKWELRVLSMGTCAMQNLQLLAFP